MAIRFKVLGELDPAEHGSATPTHKAHVPSAQSSTRFGNAASG
jgi:hypothetical protein